MLWKVIKPFRAATIALVVANVLFLVGGAFLIKFTSDMRATGWVKAMDENDMAFRGTVKDTATWVCVLGVVCCLVSVLGVVGAVMRQRKVLLGYQGVVVLICAAFAYVAVSEMRFGIEMKAWQDVDFPARNTTELRFAKQFNQVYCNAQGIHFCTNVSTTELLQIFFATVPPSAQTMLPNITGVDSLCKTGGTQGLPGAAAVCKVCSTAGQNERYGAILEWAQATCPRTIETSAWCAQQIMNGGNNTRFDTSPYSQCRDSFLNIAEGWGVGIGTLAIIGIVLGAVLFFLAWWTSSRSEDKLDKDCEKGKQPEFLCTTNKQRELLDVHEDQNVVIQSHTPPPDDKFGKLSPCSDASSPSPLREETRPHTPVRPASKEASF